MHTALCRNVSTAKQNLNIKSSGLMEALFFVKSGRQHRAGDLALLTAAAALVADGETPDRRKGKATQCFVRRRGSSASPPSGTSGRTAERWSQAPDGAAWLLSAHRGLQGRHIGQWLGQLGLDPRARPWHQRQGLSRAVCLHQAVYAVPGPRHHTRRMRSTRPGRRRRRAGWRSCPPQPRSRASAARCRGCTLPWS